MKYLAVFILSFILLLKPTLASSPHGHSHGRANMSIVIQDSILMIKCKVPAQSIVGFEHAPKTPKEKALMDQAINRMNEPDLFTFFSKRFWLLKDKEVTLNLLDRDIELLSVQKKSKCDHQHHNHKVDDQHQFIEDSEEKDAIHASSQHIEFVITHKYSLSSTAKLSSYTTASLFSRCLALDTIVVNVVTDTTQFQTLIDKHTPVGDLVHDS